MIKNLIHSFINYAKENSFEIYNEFSLQHELGIFLRKSLPLYKIQFERNVSFFYSDVKTIKHEIDICIFNEDFSEKYAIELKFPRNGQYPESMFSFIKDIKFMEELKSLGFTKTYVLTLVDDHNFYYGKTEGIYGFFRNDKLLSGIIEKPTGKKNEKIGLVGTYKIKWLDLKSNIKYYFLEVYL